MSKRLSNSECLEVISNTTYETVKREYKLNSRREYVDYCKNASAHLNPKDFKIEKDHTLDEYFKKYYKSLKKGKVAPLTADQLFLMDKKHTYWEIPNESDIFYFETISFTRRFPIFWFILIAAIIGGVLGGVLPFYLNPSEPVNPEKVYEAQINDDPHSSFVIEGGGSLSNHKPGDVIEITFTVEEGTEEGYKYGLPLDIGEGLKVDNAADAKYEFDAETGKGKLIVTFGEKDIDINLTALKYCVSEDIKCIKEYDPSGEFIKDLTVNEFRTAIRESTDDCCFVEYTFVLQQDLDISDFEIFGDPDCGSIYFGGMFDGNHKTMKIANDSLEGYNGGLFSDMSSSQDDIYAGVKNLNLYINVTISDESTYQWTGCVVGNTLGYIDISNVNVYGKMVANRTLGGIIGSANDSKDYELGGSIVNINNCKVNVDLSAKSLLTTDNYLCIGGIVGQSNSGNDDDDPSHEHLGLHINNCSYSGNISVDPNKEAGKDISQSFLGYVMGKGGGEGQPNKTVINNFTVSSDSTMEGYVSTPIYDQIPIECINKFDNTYPYDVEVGPNHDKELVGGYFNTVVIDGEEKPTIKAAAMNWFPHGGATI